MDAVGAGILISFSVLLGLNQALVKIVNDGLAPVFQSGLRSICAFLPVLLFALWMNKRLSITDGTLPAGLFSGVLFSLEFCLLFLALDFTTVARVSLFFYTMPLWLALAAHVLLPGEQLDRSRLAGLTVALGGVALALVGGIEAMPVRWRGWVTCWRWVVHWRGPGSHWSCGPLAWPRQRRK